MKFLGEANGDEILECYQALATTVGEGVYQLDADGRFVAVNDAIVELTGYGRDELLDEHVSFVVAGADVECIEREIYSHLEGGDGPVGPLDITLETATGERAPYEVRITLLRADGELRGTVGILRDVTARQGHEQELERYRSIVERINDGVYTVDADGLFTWVNNAYTEMTGYSRDELVGEHVSIVVDEQTIEEARTREGEMVAGEVDTGTLEADILTADGSTVPAEATFALLPLEDGEFERVGIVRDVTERKRAEEELRKSEERLRTLMEHSPFSIQIFDAEGRTIAANPAWERLWNAPREELDDYNILEDEQLEAGGLLPSIRDAFAGEVVELPVTNYDPADIGKPGRDRWIQGYVYPLLPGDGETFEVALVHQDVTDRKEREQELEELLERFEESNRRLEQFAYAASHDLQEPIRMVTSYLKLIEQRYSDDLDEDGEEFLAFAVDGAERMREMIRGLLEYSRVDTRREPLEPIGLDEVLADVRDDLQMKIDESDAEITVGELPCVRGDRGQLRQLFQNLLDNAIEYSDDGPPHVEIRADREADEWVVRVTDDGIGMDPDHSDRIFEVFQRLHTNEEYRGTGIGLALCQRIVERHGGDIWVDSEPGEGSTFSFTIPVSENEQPS